ncbi:MAG: C25 family cysteine peptidase, partial [Candidatus Eiseniibacteriota bacterium]
MLRILGPLLLLAAALLCPPTAAHGSSPTTRVIDLDPDRVTLEERDGTTLVRYPGARRVAAGADLELPAVVRWIELPPGVRAGAVEAEARGTVDLGPHRPPVARPGRTGPAGGEGLAEDRVEPPPGLSGTGDPARPAADPWVTLGHQGAWRGRRVAALLVRPVRWDATTGRLVAARHLDVRVELEPDAAGTPLPRHRIVPAIERRFERARAHAGALHDGANDGATDGGIDGGFHPTFRPSLDGSPVEHVIITTEALADAFERLAAWKTAKGVLSVVRTVEWIESTYPDGIDRAERIRFFIRDAYQNWGTLFVVLGGDTDQIPTRMIQSTLPVLEQIPSDMY